MEKDIYIVLTDTGTLLARVIKWFTKAPLNHASIAFDSSLQEVYSFGRKQINNPFSGGLVKENMYNPFFSDAECAIYRFSVSAEDYINIYSHIHLMMRHQYRYKYSVLGLLGVLIKKEINREDAYFCSQFVAYVLEQSNIKIVNKPPYLVQPCDFAQSPFLKEVYRGKLYNYIFQQEGLYFPAPSAARNLHIS